MTTAKPEREPEHMGGHYEGCTRSFAALALAHDLVSAELEQVLAPLFLSINEFDILVSLDNRPHKASPLSALLPVVRLSQPAISRQADRLEKRDLIRRINCPEDRRSITIQLTEKGSALLKQAIPIHERCIREKLLARLEPEERELFRIMLLKIADTNGASGSPHQ